MAGSVNKVILVGNLGSDPEMRSTPQGTQIARFSVATTENWKDRNGVKQERTEWHKVVAWDKLASICGEYLHKGKLVYVEGRIQTRSWDDQQSGQKRYMTEIRADNVTMLGPRVDRDESRSMAVASGPSPEYPPDIPDDDVPF